MAGAEAEVETDPSAVSSATLSDSSPLSRSDATGVAPPSPSSVVVAIGEGGKPAKIAARDTGGSVVARAREDRGVTELDVRLRGAPLGPPGEPDTPYRSRDGGACEALRQGASSHLDEETALRAQGNGGP